MIVNSKRERMPSTLFIALVSMFCLNPAFAALPEKRIQIDGELMIGILADFTEFTGFNDHEGCNNSLDRSAIEIVELLTYSLEKANEDNELPVKLGLTVYNDCDVDKYSLSQAVNFLKAQPYAVVLCCKKSAPTEMVSQLTAVYKVPQISYASVLKDWTDSRVTNYLLRTVAPKELQINAIIDMMIEFEWKYVSVVYLADFFGERSMRRFEGLAASASICIAYSKRVSLEDDFTAVAINLLNRSAKARVMVLFLYSPQITKLFRALAELNGTRKLIWLSISTWNMRDRDVTDDIKEVGLGGFSLRAKLKQTPQVFDFLKQLGQGDFNRIAKRNPWFSRYWDECHCKWQPTNESCNRNQTSTAEELCGRYYYAASVKDAFQVIVEGLKNYGKMRNISANSFDRIFFYESLKNVSFEGIGGRISFDNNGDNLCEYKIMQIKCSPDGKYGSEEVGSWSGKSAKLNMSQQNVVWYLDYKFNGTAPSSVCSLPCKPNEMKDELQSTCCWECEQCHVNEILAHEECTECPLYLWPDQDFTQCIPIEPHFVTIDSWKGIIISSAAVVGVVITMVVLVLYVIHRNAKLIIVSCREASFISLFGIGLNFASLFAFIGEPTVARCSMERFTFHVSFTLIYAPVLIKIIKIYKLFSPKVEPIQPLKFIRTKLQVGIILLLITVQIALTGALIGGMRVGVEKKMPDRRVPFIELLCEEPLPAFSVSIAFNFILLLVSALFGTKTRKLPQNYNEAAYIAICCNTALILVTVYIPTYFTVQQGGYKIIVMCVTQTVNGIIALGLLYVPMLYAIYLVKDEKIIYDWRCVHRNRGAGRIELQHLSKKGKNRHWSS